MRAFDLWLNETKDVPDIYNELIAVRDNEAEREDRFYKELTFGTGGLRGIIGAGTNRMNVFTVGRATSGLGDYILEVGDEKKVVIAYDSRHKSRDFAFRAAEILSAKGIHAFVFNALTPTPILSFAVRELGAGAGIVITASHNPKEYNGYKVYNKHGCQITDNAARAILEKISASGYFDKYEKNGELITIIGDEILDKYLSEIGKYSLFDRASEYAPRIVYTPLYGTGNIPVRKILEKMGVREVSVVKEQELPNGDFPTCPYPNPEERAALMLALEEGRAKGAELVLATDPDADRVGIAVCDENGEFVLLNGNETGILLLNYILERKSALGTLGTNPVAIKTIVSSDMAFSVARKYGADIREVLTGFKYIGEAMDTLDNFVMGMEESYGYLIGKFARDKDAVSAVMLITEACAYYKSLGLTLYEKLTELYRTHGYYLTDLVSKTYKGASGAARMKDIIASIRANPDIKIDGEELTFTDFGEGIDGLPKSDVLRFKGERVRILIRPSGTEPKMKIYYQIKGKSLEEAKMRLEEVKEIVGKLLV